MNTYQYHLGNIHISSENELKQFTLLQEELESNRMLYEVPIQEIQLRELKEWNDSYLSGKYRMHKNPYNQHEIWKNDGCKETVEILRDLIIVSKTDVTAIFYSQEEAIYGCLRNKICSIIREYVLGYSMFGIHAALIRIDTKKILIIGSKSSGKTSSVLNALKHNGKVYTDELIFVDENLNVSWLKRFPAITNKTIKQYFEDSNLHIKGEIYSELAGEKKCLLDIEFYKDDNFPLWEIDNIYILPLNTNNTTSHADKKRIITANWLTGKYKSNEVIEVFEKILDKSKMITISQLKKIYAEVR